MAEMGEFEGQLTQFVHDYAKCRHKDPAAVSILAGVFLANIVEKSSEFKRFRRSMKRKNPTLYRILSGLRGSSCQ